MTALGSIKHLHFTQVEIKVSLIKPNISTSFYVLIIIIIIIIIMIIIIYTLLKISRLI